MVKACNLETILAYFSEFGVLHNFRRMYNKEKKESGYAFFDVDAQDAEAFVRKPHMVRNALINCKIAAENSKISLYQKDEMERKLYVSNLPPGTIDIDLLQLFEPFGNLTKAYLVRNRGDGSCKNFGFVIFHRKSDLDRLLDESPTIKFRHRKLTIKKAVDRQTQKQTKKTLPKGNRVDLQSQASREQISSTKLQLLKRTIFINETEANYQFNLKGQVTDPVGMDLSPMSMVRTCNSFSFHVRHPSNILSLRAGPKLHK